MLRNRLHNRAEGQNISTSGYSKDLPEGLIQGSSVIVTGVLQWDKNIPYIKVSKGSYVQMGTEPAIETKALLDITEPSPNHQVNFSEIKSRMLYTYIRSRKFN